MYAYVSAYVSAYELVGFFYKEGDGGKRKESLRGGGVDRWCVCGRARALVPYLFE